MRLNFSITNGCARVGELLLVSFITLYFELTLIRWISSEIRVFAYLKNLPLIASFLGLGLGCASARSRLDFFKYFPVAMGILCLLIAFSAQLGITFLPFPTGDYLIVGDVAGGFDYSTLANKLSALGKFVGVVLVVFGMNVFVFLSLGQKLGQLLDLLPPLRGYSINIFGSLLGVLAFSAISFAGFPPLAWFVVGFALVLLLTANRKWSALTLTLVVLLIALVPQKALWSPYYRIDVSPIRAEETNPQSPIIGHNLNVNHDYHQRMLDLSEEAPNSPYVAKARPYYNLVYRFVDRPERVLVVGAGSGNDVASALRYGAQQVDAVEIDPLIIQLGKALHPEQPYSSRKVRMINNDARSFLKQSPEKYDLIIFGLLDSQTLLSSMSSIRLDNYMYTVESLSEARNRLKEGGTLSLSFALTETWLQERFYRMLREVFQQEPICLQTPYDAGISYLVGPKATRAFVRNQADLESMLINDRIQHTATPLPTDDWPFLYLKEKSIPFAYWFTLSVLFILSALALQRILIALRQPSQARSSQSYRWTRSQIYMFLLGVGFMLIEVKSISDLSLLFGSTWIVNSVVISAILLMILLANYLLIKTNPSSMSWVYLCLGLSLSLSYLLKPVSLVGLDPFVKVFLGGLVSAFPILFAGILFASAFKRVEDVPAAFGANLLGALVGGILENLSMVFGIAFLNLLAVGIYGLSLFALPKPVWIKLRLAKI